MKLTIDPRELRAALTVARRIVPRRSTLPALEHVLLTVGDGGITVESSNLEARCLRNLPAVTAEPGRACLPARTLSDVLGVFKREVSIETDGKHATITGDGADLCMPMLDAESFPLVQSLAPVDGSLSINGKAFRQMIEGAITSAAADDSRPVLAGVQMVADDGGLTVAAADGFRLYVHTVEAWPGTLSALVPWRTLAAIVRSIKPDDVISLETFGEQVRVTAPGGWWTLRTITGAFPNFRRIIPKPSEIKATATLDAEELRRLAALALSLARSVNGEPIVRLALGDGVKVTIRQYEGLTGAFRVPAELTGSAVQLAVNARFLRDALVGFGPRATIEIVGPRAPIGFRSEDGSGPRRFVVPMHVAN